VPNQIAVTLFKGEKHSRKLKMRFLAFKNPAQNAWPFFDAKQPPHKKQGLFSSPI